MKKNISITLIILLAFNIHAQDKNVEETVLTTDTSNECARNYGQGEKKNGKKVGNWRYFHPNCQVKSTGIYISGKEQGIWEKFNQDGSPRSIENYIEGVRNGEFKEYYPKKGFLRKKGSYKAGLKSGFWKFYYFNDTIKKSEGLYKADKRVGVWKSYGSKGSLFQIWNHDTNEIKEFNPYTKKVEKEGLHVDGKRIGIWKEYYQNEQLKFEKEYFEGKLWNIIKYHDENGNDLDIGTFKNGNGILKIYDRHGTPTQNHPYEEGKRKNIIYLDQ